MNKYEIINYISNYLDKNNPDKEMKQIINNILLNIDNIAEYNNLIFQFSKLNLLEDLNIKTQIYYKITKEHPIETLYGNNNFHHDYIPDKVNICNNKTARQYLNEIGIKICDNNVLSDNEGKNGRHGLHFLPELDNEALISNICMFGETMVLGINDPQIYVAQKNNTTGAKTNIISFDEIFIKEKYLAISPIVFKEFFVQLTSDIRQYVNKFYKNKYNSIFAKNGFDAIIEKLKIIEITEQNINTLSQITDTIDVQLFIRNQLKTFQPQKYKPTINFLQQTKEIYLEVCKEPIFPVEIFIKRNIVEK